MKLTKKEIEDRFIDTRDLVTVEKLKKPYVLNKNQFSYKFKNRLTIIIPGKVIADSRPRVLSTHTFNPHKALLMRIFKNIYTNSPLEDMIILSAMKFDIEIYEKPSDTFKKETKRKKLNIDLYKQPVLAKPDIDNVAKVHYDILQDIVYSVILHDEFIIDSSLTKYYSETEYSKCIIYFNEILSDFEEYVVYRSADFFKFKFTYKYMCMNKIKPEKWYDFIRKITEKKSINKKFIKFFKKTLNTYDISVLNKIAPQHEQYTKSEQINMISFDLFGEE